MALRVCVLASGSGGNSVFVSSDRTGILVDAGLSAKRTVEHLAHIGVAVEAIDAICLSHEHDDHARGVRVLQRRHQLPVFANRGTIDALTRNEKLRSVSWEVFTTGSVFTVGDLAVETFMVPHDAYEPVGFVISNGVDKVGIAMDLGSPTTLIRENLRSCRAIVIESNYDEQLLRNAPRPWSLKQRISGRQGHLSNDHAARMLSEIAGPQLHQVFLAHLSRECNRHDLAVDCCARMLEKNGHRHVNIEPTYPDRVSRVWESSARPTPPIS